MTEQKRITLTHNGHRNWSAIFEGQVTRRDIQKLHRVLVVEYAKVERRRSVKRLMQPIETQTKDETNDRDKRDDPGNVYIPGR